MIPCSSCHRHVREIDTVCPFCGAERRTIGAGLAGVGALAVVAVLGASGCAARPGLGEDGVTTSTSSTSTSTSTSTSESDTTTESDSDSETTITTLGDGDGDPTDDSNISLSFYACSDPYDWSISECDPIYQDCPEGEKCVAYSDDGQTLDANKCVPVTGDGASGEPCTYGGVVEGTDDCDADNACFDVVEQDGVLVGTCTPFCQPPLDDPTCGDGLGCFIPVGQDESVALCLPGCDPLLQDCAMDQLCVWGNADFVCLDGPGGGLGNGEPCVPHDQCAPGLVCANGTFLPDCAAPNCCTEYCDINDPNYVCTNPNYMCTPFWLDEPPPPEYANIGACVVPP